MAAATLKKSWDRGMFTTVSHHLLIPFFKCLGIEDTNC